MTSRAQVAVLGPAARVGERSNAPPANTAQRVIIRLVTFAALGLYGIVRWGTLLSPAPTWRLLALLVLAVLIAGAGGVLVRFSRAAAVLGAVLAVLLILPIAGVRFGWIWHVRIAVTADAIGNGLIALPHMLVPYPGPSDWVRIVIVLGAGVLLLDAAFVLALAPRALGDLQRAGAALPLVALAIVPATLVRPSLPYLQGLLLFALLAAFLWGERIRSGGLMTACAVAALAGVGGAIIAPHLDHHKPWLNYEALAGNVSAAHVDTFTWGQQYGRLRWPRTGHEVMDVEATHAEYWKAENLDVFDGHEWTQGTVASDQSMPQPAAGPLSRWKQTIQVTIRDMNTTDVIAAGTAMTPEGLPGQIEAGASPGTWARSSPLGPGASYTISVIDPTPSSTQLAHAGSAYPVGLSDYRSLALPRSATVPPATIEFPAFHSALAVRSADGGNGTQIVNVSPYARAYALAQSLERRARNPYDYVQAVLGYLHHGFVYDENPPAAQFPLESFLFDTKLGYCQQFSGVMALLLRMGGIPARVAAGFTSGSYSASTRQFVVTDIDAHDWVEAWFPQYGWVRFDPTPASDPARRSATLLPALPGANPATVKPQVAPRRADTTPASGAPSISRRHGNNSEAIVIIALIALLVALGFAARIALRVSEPSTDELLAELERALRRCRRPIGVAVTLAELEQRFRSSPEAADYIRSLRLARFAGRPERPTLEQRRALRAQLAAGLGLPGALRAIWALPPRRYISSRWASLWPSKRRPGRLN